MFASFKRFVFTVITMNNLGQILQEARKSKNLSLRDASDATKIRTDYLEDMEQGDFSFNLPEIYRRGFLRLYAEFLDLDQDAVMSSYDVMKSGGAKDKASPKAQAAKSQFLEKMKADSDEQPPSAASRYDNEPKSDEFNHGPASPLVSTETKKSNNTLKVAAVLSAVLLLIIILVWALSGKPESKPEITEPVASAGQANAVCTIVITATRDTFYKLSLESDPMNVLFNAEVRAGDKKTFATQENLVLTPRNIENLRLERNGTPVEITGRASSYRIKAVMPN